MYEEDDPEVSETIQREKERVPRNGNGPLLLVQFYDARNTWYGVHSVVRYLFSDLRSNRQWLPVDKLKLLGEDKGE